MDTKKITLAFDAVMSLNMKELIELNKRLRGEDGDQGVRVNVIPTIPSLPSVGFQKEPSPYPYGSEEGTE